MFKPIDRATVQPVTSIMPVLAVDDIGSVAEEMSHSAALFVKGHLYAGQVLSKLSQTDYQVKISSAAHDASANDAKLVNQVTQDVMVKMSLGSSARVGQHLWLRFMHNSPQLTFLLSASPSHIAESAAEISPAAHIIAKNLQQAELTGVASHILASQVITQQPKNAQLLAQQLQNSVSSSGLFYEAHLADWLQGKQALAAIMQEPQNQNPAAMANLMSQQLAVLEHQRIAWQGEVWPGQKMQWDIALNQPVNNQDEPARQALATEQARPIVSELTLHLPNLGRVSAKISLIDGNMQMHILAEQDRTIKTLTQQKQSLHDAIVKNGQHLTLLSLAQQH